MQHAMDSPMTQIAVQYFDYLALVDELDLVIMPIRVYNQVLG